MKLSKRQLKRIIREEKAILRRQGLLKETGVTSQTIQNMNYLIPVAKEWLEDLGDDWDSMESFCAEMAGEGYDRADCDKAWDAACEELGYV